MKKTRVSRQLAIANALPTTQHQQIEKARQDCKLIEDYLRPVAAVACALRQHTLSEATQITAAKSQLAVARDIWAAVGRRASREEIAVEIAELFALYTNLSKSSVRHLVAVMLEDMFDQHPLVFAVICACRALRQEYKFAPTIAEMLKELKRAKAHACKHENLVDDIPRLETELTKALPLLPRWRAEQELRRTQREEAEAQRLEALRHKVEEYSVAGLYLFIRPEDRERLGLKESDDGLGST